MHGIDFMQPDSYIGIFRIQLRYFQVAFAFLPKLELSCFAENSTETNYLCKARIIYHLRSPAVQYPAAKSAVRPLKEVIESPVVQNMRIKSEKVVRLQDTPIDGLVLKFNVLYKKAALFRSATKDYQLVALAWVEDHPEGGKVEGLNNYLHTVAAEHPDWTAKAAAPKSRRRAVHDLPPTTPPHHC
ncbi:hypothetical protein Pelo_18828 [Pelomyxa schiedti]|nr:hypothetical protein Pelo_18828 [Pelomyxa schiedti]